MIGKIHKFGHSLAVVIPASSNKRHEIEPGSLVEITETPDGWQVKPVTVVPRLPAEVKRIADELAETRADVFKALGQ